MVVVVWGGGGGGEWEEAGLAIAAPTPIPNTAPTVSFDDCN